MGNKLTTMQHSMIKTLLAGTDPAAADWSGVPGLRYRIQSKLVRLGLVVVGNDLRMTLTPEGRKRAQENN